MQIDTDDLVPSSELTRNTALYVRQAAEGRRFVIINNSVPKAALVSIDDLKRLAALGDLPQTRTANVSAYLGLLGIDDIDTYRPDLPGGAWAEHQDNSDDRAPLTAPIGLTDTGVCTVDFSTATGLLLAGCADSAKNTVRTLLLLALCARYSPQRLKVLIVDYRGGGDYSAEACLPHVDILRRPPGVHMGGVLNRAEFAPTVIDRVTEFIDDRAQRSTLDDVPELLVVIDGYPGPDSELTTLAETLLIQGPALKIRPVIITERFPVADPDTVHGTCRITLRQNTIAATRAALGEEPYPPLKQDEAATVSNETGSIVRIQLFNTEPDEPGVSEHWMHLLTHRIALAVENEMRSQAAKDAAALGL